MITVNDILLNIRTYLEAERSTLATFKPFSNIYYLFRAIAVAIADVINTANTPLLSTAVNEELDRIAQQEGIIRISGERAVGNVLLTSSSSIVIPADTLLSVNGIQLRTTAIAYLNNIDKVVPIVAVKEEEILIPAGLPVQIRLYTTVQGVVGSYRSSDGSAKGAILGGSLPESDDALRRRVQEVRQLGERGTSKALRASITNTLPGIGRVAIVDGKPAPGYITVFTEASDDNALAALACLVDQHKPLGIAYSIQKLTTTPYNLRISIETEGDVNETRIKEVVERYLSLVPPLVTPNDNELLANIRALPNVKTATLLTPITALPYGTVAILESLEVVISV